MVSSIVSVMKPGMFWIISNRFIEGRHSVYPFGSKWRSKSLPSASDGSLNLVFVMMMGGWNGNLSLNKMSKLKVSTAVGTDKAVLEISSYNRMTNTQVSHLAHWVD